MNTEILIAMIAQKIADLRGIHRLISKPDFHILYLESTDKKRLDRLIEQGSFEALRTWYKSKLSENLGDKNIRELREIASALVIPEYTRLKKSLLLAEIMKRKEHERESVASNNIGPQCDATADSGCGSGPEDI